ncbi:uncharacterized protein LOC124917342 [Impatiens glandulifera]|uniref:uncharacterized protein LOC124917342 n=1 Tax=Impatiens glandulifera TaxID=253017 RepID=UPI001FB0D42B|nr:uncharacterized protein LOC124917342 [Impatiens glandulifera]
MDDEMSTILKEGPIKIEKEKGAWTAGDRRRNKLDNHCKRHIFKSLDINTFVKGNEKTKENKILVATQKYENIIIKPRENMKEFSDRFTSVVNEFYTLGKRYDNKEIIVKALRSLSSAWDIKTMVMRESNNLAN